ncbi:O-antigen ligase family protein [Arsenicicoccus sp. oral taxon 190]|uniref:O-antigen ligase family protein n=1 Tax=Arsenicicoccus sp. oral taxon 190 TaxID=1658671 RepID=UPI000AA244CA|nr:O-antigen ligase family protein [Arsenicicoccus sp. oral taxon 190]
MTAKVTQRALDPLPPAGTPPERIPAYVWLFLASTALNLFSGNSGLMGFPVPPDRVLLLGSLVLLALEPHRDRLRPMPVYVVMGVLTLWTAWSALSAGTLASDNGFYALLDRIMVPFLMFSVGGLLFSTTHRRDLLLRTLTLIGLYLGAVSVLCMVGPKQLVFPRYIMDYLANNPMARDDPRAVGPFLSSEANGMALALCAFAAALLWTRTRNAGWRLLVLLTIPASAAGLILTLTRSSWLAALLGIALIALVVPRARRWFALAGVLGAAALGSALLAMPSLMELATGRLTTSRSLYDRANTYEAGWRALGEQPLFGIGWSRFIDIGTEWVRQAPDYPITTVTIEIHNVFLSRAVETGIPGALLWITVIVLGPVTMLWRARQTQGELRSWWLFLVFALAVWFVPSMTSPNPYPFPNYLMWLIAGIAGRTVLVRNCTSHTGEDGIERPWPREDS